MGGNVMKRAVISAVAVLAVAAISVSPAAAQSAFPPAPPKVSPIAGAIDFHVHSSPDVFGRNVSDIEVAMVAKRAGMRGIVLKNHVTSTSDRAALVMEAVPGIEVFGGIVLNNAVGGINTVAVEWMHRMEGGRGKVVWFPTFDADNHQKNFAKSEGIKILVNGKLIPAVDEVLKVIARENLVLHTGHAGPEATLALIKRAHELGVKNIAVTHAMATVPGLSIEQMKKAAEFGAMFEHVYLNVLMGPNATFGWMRHWRQVSTKDMAEAIKAVGADHFILASDLGQSGNPIHPDGYNKMVAGLKADGVSDEDIDKMMRKNPAKLLGLN
jgi:microsomal dipeptidase-like Zn-dependent dipeptidase